MPVPSPDHVAGKSDGVAGQAQETTARRPWGDIDRCRRRYGVGGLKGTVRHSDGKGWTVQDPGTSATLYGVWGTSASEIYVVGDKGTVLRRGP